MTDCSRADPIAEARALAPAIAEAADTIERTGRIPAALMDRLHGARLARMLLPRSVGGDEVEPGVFVQAVEEAGRHDGSVAWLLFQANSSALLAAYLPLDSAQTIFADARAVIAWGPPGAPVAQAVPGGYRVSGTWHFASGCRNATWMGVHCAVVEPDGTRRLNRWGRPTIRTLLFPADQARLIDDWNVIGLRGTASDSYELADLFVPEAFSSTREDPELRREPGRLYAFSMSGLYAAGAAGVALGLARAMLDAVAALAQRKTPRGLGRLADSPTFRAGLAREEARLRAARAWLLQTLSEAHAAATGEAPLPVATLATVRLACSHTIQTAIEAGEWAYRAAGSDAIFAAGAFDRRFRDLHTLSQQTQARLAHFETVGAVMLGDVSGAGAL